MLTKLSAWVDVQKKAWRLYSTGRVTPVAVNGKGIKCTVQGDHGTYTTVVGEPNSSGGEGAWSCTCPWGQWAWRRVDKYRGRPCSHALATGRMWSLSGIRGKDDAYINPNQLSDMWKKVFVKNPADVKPDLTQEPTTPMPLTPEQEEIPDANELLKNYYYKNPYSQILTAPPPPVLPNPKDIIPKNTPKNIPQNLLTDNPQKWYRKFTSNRIVKLSDGGIEMPLDNLKEKDNSIPENQDLNVDKNIETVPNEPIDSNITPEPNTNIIIDQELQKQQENLEKERENYEIRYYRTKDNKLIKYLFEKDLK